MIFNHHRSLYRHTKVIQQLTITDRQALHCTAALQHGT